MCAGRIQRRPAPHAARGRTSWRQVEALRVRFTPRCPPRLLAALCPRTPAWLARHLLRVVTRRCLAGEARPAHAEDNRPRPATPMLSRSPVFFFARALSITRYTTSLLACCFSACLSSLEWKLPVGRDVCLLLPCLSAHLAPDTPQALEKDVLQERMNA